MASRVLSTGRFEIKAYVSEECFRAIENTRNPETKRGTFCAMALEEIFVPRG